jgi:hypothetical protein
MKVYKMIKDAPAPDTSLKSKKAGRISKLEIGMDISVQDMFSFT